MNPGNPVEPGVNPADRGRGPAYVVAHVKLCPRPHTNFGGIWPLTKWEPGVNPTDRGRDPAYVVAHVKLCLCTNFV